MQIKIFDNPAKGTTHIRSTADQVPRNAKVGRNRTFAYQQSEVLTIRCGFAACQQFANGNIRNPDIRILKLCQLIATAR
jgi:phosphodiesterase/alkaline phosphatase D-like protein